MAKNRRFPAEWEKQSGILLAFPHADSDWAPYLEEAEQTFAALAHTIARYQPCLILCDDTARIQNLLGESENIHAIQLPTNDTWCRDFGAISVMDGEFPKCLDFTFNGWGNKYDAALDNQITLQLAELGFISIPEDHLGFVLEGGSIDSNGEGILLTTSTCLLEENRNPHLSKQQIESHIKENLGIHTVLWLDHGYLEGDDTDSHIDMLARFIDSQTILYVKCENPDDPHFKSLQKMENELRSFRQSDGSPFTLIPLPFADPIFQDGTRLPASYANFLIINDAVLLPIYNLPQDQQAIEICKKAFPGRDVIPVDCTTLIRQGGSLHCSTMQFPEGGLLL